MTNTSQNNQKTYFNLHTTGVGYINRIREVTPKKGESFLACTVAALVGPSDGIEYRYFDVRVSGNEAQELIKRCENVVAAEKKVLIRFCIGDLWVDTFTYEKGLNKGKTGTSLKGRLLKIHWIKIDGKLVYQLEKQDEQSEGANNAPEETADALQNPEKVSNSESQPAAASEPQNPANDSF